MLGRLLRWRRRKVWQPQSVVIYSRVNCHLCDDAKAVLEKYLPSGYRGLSEVDVDTNEILRREYGEWVPVVEIDGKVRFRGRVNEVLLKRLIDNSLTYQKHPDGGPQGT